MPTPSTEIVKDKLPAGIDWADGLGKNLGTPSPSGSILANADNGSVHQVSKIPLEELPDSPTLERAEQATVTHSFVLPYSEALNKLAIYGRGALRQDSVGNYYRVLSSSVTRMKGNMARLQIVSESLSYDNPPDEFHVVPVELNIDILKHPRYFYALMPTNQIPNFDGIPDTSSQAAFKQQIIRAIQAYRENPVVPVDAAVLNVDGKIQQQIEVYLKELKSIIKTPNPNFRPEYPATAIPPVGSKWGSLPYPPMASPTQQKPNPQYYYTGYNFSSPELDANNKVFMAASAAWEIINKIWRMEDTPYVVGWQIVWSSYYFRPPPLNPGGYIQAPETDSPALPDYFYSTGYPPDPSKSIFAKMSYYNPQCYSSNGQYGGNTSISWLRKADEIEYQRTWFKVTRSWLGAPIGAWDADLYSRKERPIYGTQYHSGNLPIPPT
jgi:hypothetical protein